jgi:hypothetical protein
MRGITIKKILAAFIIIAPIFFSYIGCKKQPKCGCGKDILYTFSKTSCNIYFTDSSVITAMLPGDPYKTYSFCNPSQMFPKLANAKSGDLLLVSGNVYYNCAYVSQSSSSSYQNPYIAYDIQVTDLSLDLYGKK